MFNTPGLGIVTNNQIGGAGSAIMHLFSPRNFSNQAKRPLSYSFDGNFAIAASDAIQHSVSNHDNSRITALVSNPKYMGAVMPTAMPDHIMNLQTLNDFWTFMLIINNDKTTNGTQPGADNLQLYYGYFLQEPINPLMHMGHITHNPQAQLVVTHKTMVTKLSYMGQYGHGSRLDTVSNVDIIPTRSMGYMIDRPTKLIRPHELYHDLSVAVDGSASVMQSEDSFLTNMEGSVDVHAKLAVPKTNLGKVLDGVATTQASLQAGSLDGSVNMFGGDLYHSLLSQNLQDGASSNIIGLPTNIIINMDYVVNRYHPVLNPIKMEREARYMQRDQAAGSATNVFSSMLATIVPPILTDFVIAQISFSYDSHADAMMIHGYAPISPMSETEVKTRVNGMLHRLRHEIFPIMKLQRGDFNIEMSCDTTNITNVILNFYCDSIRNMESFEVPTMLGGLNSALIASSDVSTANSGELSRLLCMVQDDDRDTAPFGLYDQRRFQQGIASYDNNTGYTPPGTDWGV